MKKEQQPAFPCTEKLTININDGIPHTGLTKREYIAVKAMQGILSSPNMRTTIGNDVIAKAAFAYADAMIAFEEKEGKE